jgi:sugar phosphate permease
VATAGTAVLTAGIAQALVTRFGARWPMAFGLALMTAGMVWYTQIPVEGSFVADLLPGYLLVGVGLPFAFIPVSIAALAGVGHHEAGLASGLLNTSQQIGGAVGVAVASTVFATHFGHELASGADQPAALTSGFRMAFWVLAGISAFAVVTALSLIRREELASEPEPVTAAT